MYPTFLFKASITVQLFHDAAIRDRNSAFFLTLCCALYGASQVVRCAVRRMAPRTLYFSVLGHKKCWL
jgi:hypothetical protein